MNISQKGLDLIRNFEGFKAFPYQDARGIWTIGYGTTYYPNGFKVSHTDMSVNEEQAMTCLRYHIDRRVIPAIKKHLGNDENIALSQHQIDALCSFVYNIGASAFEGSTLLKDIRSGAAAEVITTDFMMWVKSGGMLLKGLIKRRQAEADYFNNGK